MRCCKFTTSGALRTRWLVTAKPKYVQCNGHEIDGLEVPTAAIQPSQRRRTREKFARNHFLFPIVRRRGPRLSPWSSVFRRACCDAGRRDDAGKILFRRSALRAGGAADARAGDAGADAQSDASAAGKADDRAVDPDLRRCPARLALSGRAVRRRLRSSRSISAASCCSPPRAPRSRRRCSPSSTRWCSCSRGSRCWIFLRSTFGLFAIAAFMHGFRKSRPHLWFALAGLAFGLVGRLQMERIVSARGLHRHRRR